MKIIIFYILVISFSYSSILSNSDIYFELKEKERIEYINKISKHSLKNINNTIINGDDILNSRNSKLVNIITFYQTNNNEISSISSNEILLINKLEEISLKIIEDNGQINCDSLTNSVYNDISISLVECVSLDLKIRNIYKSGVYSQNRYDNHFRIRSNYLNETDILHNVEFSNKLGKIIINDIKTQESIKYMNANYIKEICDKYTNISSKTFINKQKTINSIINRALKLGITTDVIKCMTYNYQNHRYNNGIYVSTVNENGTLILLNRLLDYLNNELKSTNEEIDNLTNLINTKRASLPVPAPVPKDISYLILEASIDTSTTHKNNLILIKDELDLSIIDVEYKISKL